MAEALSHAGVTKPLVILGLPDEFVEHGDPVKLMSMCGLDATGIEQSVRERLPQVVPVTVAAAGSNVTPLRG